MATIPAERREVAIAGTGPAGCALAIALARRGIRACVIEKEAGAGARPGEMLQPAARPLLAELGLDLGDQPTAYGVSSSWESEQLHENDFFFGTKGDGWLLDRDRFEATLRATARDLGVAFVRDVPAATLLVDATGRAAAIARARGAKRTVYDQLTGVFTLVDAQRPADRFTLVEAVENGWWYAASVAGGRMVVALMSDSDIIRRERLLDPARWRAAFEATRHARGRARDAELRAPLRARTASSSLLEPVAGEGWLAIGDAASMWDPLSASGIYKALHNALEAADAIAEGAIDAYARSVRTAFESYLQTRDAYYALVRRWPESLFWQRRQHTITLDPAAMLRTRDASRATLARVDPRLRIEEIVALCRDARPAHDIVAACAPRHGDARVILALQAMLREGVLV
jgi:flavin-dependent dehydrogenase